MAAVNRRGLKMVGLKKASSATTNWVQGSGGYVQIDYDMSDGEILTAEHISLGGNSWTEYHSADIIRVCTTSKHMTMQEIADAIETAVAEERFMRRYNGEE